MSSGACMMGELHGSVLAVLPSMFAFYLTPVS